MKEVHPSIAHLLQFFVYDHLDEPMRSVSKSFSDLAYTLVYGEEGSVPQNQELSVGLRKLIEAKDCAVRAVIAGNGW